MAGSSPPAFRTAVGPGAPRARRGRRKAAIMAPSALLLFQRENSKWQAAVDGTDSGFSNRQLHAKSYHHDLSTLTRRRQFPTVLQSGRLEQPDVTDGFPSGFAGLPTTVPPVPVEPHLGDQTPVRLTEHGTPGVHPLAGSLPAEHALELGREPRPCRVDLTRGKRDLRLTVGDVEPPPPDRLGAPEGLRERSLDEHRLGGEHGHDLIHVYPSPPGSERIDQRSPQGPGVGYLLRRRCTGNFIWSHAFQHTSLLATPRCDDFGTPRAGGHWTSHPALCRAAGPVPHLPGPIGLEE